MSETGMVKINDLEMEYAKFGSGDKVFVILPGLSIKSVIPSVDAVDDAYGILNEEFTSYLFDRRKTVPEGYSIYDMADDTAAVMKELGLSDTYVFGASQGGMIAMAMTIRYPELVKKLVLGSTSPHVKPHQRAVLDRWIDRPIIDIDRAVFVQISATRRVNALNYTHAQIPTFPSSELQSSLHTQFGR